MLVGRLRSLAPPVGLECFVVPKENAFQKICCATIKKTAIKPRMSTKIAVSNSFINLQSRLEKKRRSYVWRTAVALWKYVWCVATGRENTINYICGRPNSWDILHNWKGYRSEEDLIGFWRCFHFCIYGFFELVLADRDSRSAVIILEVGGTW